MVDVISVSQALRRWKGPQVNSYQRWIASHEHFQLERLRHEDPERYQQLYSLIVYAIRNACMRDITD